MGGVAKLPPPLVAGLPQLWVAGLAQPPRKAPLSPPVDPALAGQQPPSPLPGWQCPAPTSPPPLHTPPTAASAPAPHPSLGVAAPQRAPSPGPSRWQVAPVLLPGHLSPSRSWAPWTGPTLVQVPEDAPARQSWRTPSSSPPLLLAALPQPPLPLWLAPLKATLVAHPACAGHLGTTKSPSHHQWVVRLLCTP